MSLPGHRRTSSDKRRRAAHFALAKPTLVTTAGVVHRSHRAAPGAMEYNGIAIHVKGRERKVQKMLNKTKSKATKVVDEHAGHDHDHAGHTHS
ncbi:50S ribosomal protein L32 [Patescibacteria group bacterium]|nr:50S ribosomal protein L32 [Patescibacteria group bacterium]